MGHQSSKPGGSRSKGTRREGSRQISRDVGGTVAMASDYSDGFVPSPHSDQFPGGLPGGFPGGGFPPGYGQAGPGQSHLGGGMVLDNGVYLPDVPPLMPGMRGVSHNIQAPGYGPAGYATYAEPPMQPMQMPMGPSMPGGPSYNYGAAVAPSYASRGMESFVAPGGPMIAGPGVMTGQSYHMGGAAPQPIIHAAQPVGGPVPKGAPMPMMQAQAMQVPQTVAAPIAYAAPAPVTMASMPFGSSYVPPVSPGVAPYATAAPVLQQPAYNTAFVAAPVANAVMAAPAQYVPSAPASYVPPIAMAVPLSAASRLSASYASPMGYDRPLRGYDRFEESGIARERPIERAGHDSVVAERQITRDELAATGNLIEEGGGYARGGDYGYERSERGYDYSRAERSLDYGRADYGRERNYGDASPMYETASYDRAIAPGRRGIGASDYVSGSYRGDVGVAMGSSYDAYGYSASSRALTSSAVPYEGNYRGGISNYAGYGGAEGGLGGGPVAYV